MDCYCNTCTLEDERNRGRMSVTLPVLLFNEYHHLKQWKKLSSSKQKEKTALREVRKVAIDRVGWAGFTKELCRDCCDS